MTTKPSKRHEEIARIVAEYTRAGNPPKTQNECCALAALVTLRLDTRPHPWPDTYIIETAADMATGLFGEAFEKGDYARKVIWIDMAEYELRRAIIRRDRGR